MRLIASGTAAIPNSTAPRIRQRFRFLLTSPKMPARMPSRPPRIRNTASVTTRLEGTDLSLAKRGPATLAAGSTASYVLTISNSGPTTAANVTVTDVMPAGLTLVSASVVSGSFTLITSETVLTAVAPTMAAGSAVIALTVAVGDAVTGSVTNVANVTSTTSDLQPSNNVGSTTAGVLGADLAITKLGPPTISAAGTATYTLVITNYGPSSAGNVTVTDVMPVGLTLVGASASSNSITLVAEPEKFVATATAVRVGTTVTVTLTVQAAYTATGTVTNIANVTSTTPDPTVTNNIGSVSSVIKASMRGGVTTAPMEAPLCSTLLPMVRSLGSSSAKVVFSAQGQ